MIVTDYDGYHLVNFHENDKDGALLLIVTVSSATESLSETEKTAKKTQGQDITTSYIKLNGMNDTSVLKVQYRNRSSHPQSPDGDTFVFINGNSAFNADIVIPNLESLEDKILSTFKFTK